jgi:hypothetical protein
VYIANVMAVYDGADDKARRAGMSWYTDCWAWCCSTGEVYNVDASVVAGIFCAFSPQCTVAYAMAITESMLARGGVARGHTSRQCETAHYVYHGGDASKLLGKHKTHHFYWGIVIMCVSTHGKYASSLAIGVLTWCRARGITTTSTSCKNARGVSPLGMGGISLLHNCRRSHGAPIGVDHGNRRCRDRRCRGGKAVSCVAVSSGAVAVEVPILRAGM